VEEAGVGSGLLPVVRPTFLADPHRVSRNRDLMAAKITMMLEGEMRRKFHGGGSTEMTHDSVPRTHESRFMRAFFASKRISLTSPLCRFFDESSFLSSERETKM